MGVKYLQLSIVLVLSTVLLGCTHNKRMHANTHSNVQSVSVIQRDATPDSAREATLPAQKHSTAPPLAKTARKMSTSVNVPSGIHPVLYDDMLMGGLLHGKIVDNYTMRKALTGTEVYRCYTQTAFAGRGYGHSIEENDFGIYVDLRDTPNGRDSGKSTTPETGETPPQGTSFKWQVAISGDWNAIPRVASEGNPKLPEIKRAVANELRRHGITQPDVNIRRVWNIDLDGDGVREMVVDALCARFLDGLSKRAQPGDYTCVLLMQKHGHAWTSSLLDGIFFTKAYLAEPTTEGTSVVYTTKGFYDIDGDGVMEMLVGKMLCETDAVGASFYRITPQGAVETKLAS